MDGRMNRSFLAPRLGGAFPTPRGMSFTRYLVVHGLLVVILSGTMYVFPFVDVAVSSAIAKVAGQERSEEKFREVARSIFEVYERRRLAGQHDGPELEGMRIYRVVWVLQAGLENRELPDSTQLLTEYSPLQ